MALTAASCRSQDAHLIFVRCFFCARVWGRYLFFCFADRAPSRRSFHRCCLSKYRPVQAHASLLQGAFHFASVFIAGIAFVDVAQWSAFTSKIAHFLEIGIFLLPEKNDLFPNDEKQNSTAPKAAYLKHGIMRLFFRGDKRFLPSSPTKRMLRVWLQRIVRVRRCVFRKKCWDQTECE